MVEASRPRTLNLLYDTYNQATADRIIGFLSEKQREYDQLTFRAVKGPVTWEFNKKKYNTPKGKVLVVIRTSGDMPFDFWPEYSRVLNEKTNN